jgi:hypothetical protein
VSRTILLVQSGTSATPTYCRFSVTHRIGSVAVDAGSKAIPMIVRAPPAWVRTVSICSPVPSDPSAATGYRRR